MNKKKKSTNISPYPDEASKEKQGVPTGNALLYISLSYVDFSGCVRVGAPCFCFVLNLLTHGSQPYSTEEYRSFFQKKLPRRNLLKGPSGKLLKKKKMKDRK